MNQNLFIIELKGDLTLAKGDQTLAQIKQAIKAKTGSLLLDLTDLHFVDSAGLAILVRLQKLTDSMGIGMALCSLPMQVNQLLQLTSMSDFFEIFDNRDAFYQTWSRRFPQGSFVPPLDTISVAKIATE